MEIKDILSISNYNETHYILKLFGIKIKFPKPYYAKKKKESPYYYYKKNNIDITKIPCATGQIRDIQLANLALLKEFDYVCNRANLNYWLDAGTLLGAVRHKGFIPWDDDIDVGMLREDYNKIIEAFENFARNKSIYAKYTRLKNSNCQGIIKIIHKECSAIFVDVFPFDIYGRKETKEEQIKNTKILKQYRSELEQQCTKDTTDKDIIEKISYYMQNKVLINKIPKDLEQSEIVWGLDYNHSWKNWFTNYDVIFPLKKIQFENIEFSCMNKPHEFLSRLYGNYMSYPKKITFGHNSYQTLSPKDKAIIKSLTNSVNVEKNNGK